MKHLVGKGKPFHSAVDKTAALLKRKVGTGAEFMKELQGLGGIKQAEIDERGLSELMGAPKMTHEQFMKALSAKPAPAIREKVLGEKPEPPSKEVLRRNANDLIRVRAREYASEGSDTSAEYRALAAEEMQRLRSNHMDQALRLAEEHATKNPSSTYHEAYTLPSGENYREMLIKAPKVETQFGDENPYFNGVYSHFGGEPAILASMRLKDRTGPNGEKLLHLEELQSDWHQQGREKGYKVRDPLAEEYKKLEQKMFSGQMSYTPAEEKRFYDLQEQGYDDKPVTGVPDAPFKKNWEEMALKRLIHHAAEKGYHGIVVTPGAEQANRYNLANHIDSLHFSRNSDGTVDINAVKDRNTVVDKTMQTPEQIESMVGKDLAQKIFNTKTSFGSLEGLDLQVGGEGMKGFYDKKVPNILNAIGKKYGVKAQLGGHKIQTGTEYVRNAQGDITHMEVPKYAQLHHFPITEQMRKDVLTNGLPLYQKGGIIHKAQGGAVKTFDYENPQHTMSVAVHLSRHPEFKKASSPAVDIKNILHEMLSKGDYRFLEDPRTQEALHKAGHDSYFVQEKTGKVSYPIKHVVKKAFGGSINEMKAEMMGRKPVSLNDLSQIGANEAPDMNVKAYVPPTNEEKLPVGGVSTHEGALPIGGVDMNTQQQGQQLVPQSLAPQQPPQGQQGGLPPQGQQGASAGASSPAQQSNILQMTPQGQALSALKPVQQQQQPMPQMADGGLAHLKDGDQPPKKKPTVAEQKQAIFAKAQEGLMKPSEALGKHEGKYMHITEADRAKVEKRKHGMRGGVGFSQIGLEDPNYAGRVWGVGKSSTAIKLLNRQKRGLSPEDKSVFTTFIGTPEMHTSNQLVFNRMWNKFQEARKAGLLSPEQEAEMLDIMRSAMTKETKKNPSKPVFDPNVNFDNTHHMFDTFERRRILSDLMSGKKIGGKKAQIFDATKMIEDTTDPRLLHAPSLSVGPHVFSFSGKTSYEPELNKAFPFMLHGETSPEAFQQLPFTEAAPEFTEEIRKTKGREPGYMDIVRKIPRQFISEEYLTGLQKKGKKKGGKVSMDVMTLELTRKSKKAK